MLKLNENGKYVMPRGLSVTDMAYEIKDAVREQDFISQVDWYDSHLKQDFTAVRNYVKVTSNGNIRKTTLSKVR